MIDPKSLRIGNYIQDETGEFFIVDEIRPDYINAGALGIYSAGFHDDFYIPLSPSLLERAGFEKHKDFTNWWAFEDIGIKHDFGTWMVYLNSYVSSIDYYHQIQNIVYDLLKGKELELKP